MEESKPESEKNYYLNILKSLNEENGSLLAINFTSIPKNKYVKILDFKLNSKKVNDDHQYLKSEFHHSFLRRGNSLIVGIFKKYLHVHDDDITLNMVEKSMILRKGMKKFYDIKNSFISDNLFAHNDADYYERDKNSMIFKAIKDSYKKENPVKILVTKKFNGICAYVTYCKHLESFVISSKNVSIASKVKNMNFEESYKSTLEYYKDMKNPSKFRYAFKILEKFYDNLKNLFLDHIRQIMEFCSDKTIIGEYCSKKEPHIIKPYSDEIYFFAAVQNDSDDICLPVEESFKFFERVNLKFVNKFETGQFINFKDLNQYLIELKKNIEKEIFGNQRIEMEGTVLYFSNSENKVISMAKIKSSHYKILKAVRSCVELFIQKLTKQKALEEFKLQAQNICKENHGFLNIDLQYSILNLILSDPLILDLQNSKIRMSKSRKDKNDPLIVLEFQKKQASYNFLEMYETYKNMLDHEPGNLFRMIKKSPYQLLRVIVFESIPGIGKSHYIEAMIEDLKQHKKPFKILSSDDVRSSCMEEYRSRGYCDLNELQSSLMKTIISFNHELWRYIVHFGNEEDEKEESERLIIVDKNYTLESIFDLFPNYLSIFSEKEFQIEVITMNFDLKSLFVALLRCKFRKNHKTLNPSLENTNFRFLKQPLNYWNNQRNQIFNIPEYFNGIKSRFHNFYYQYFDFNENKFEDLINQYFSSINDDQEVIKNLKHINGFLEENEGLLAIINS